MAVPAAWTVHAASVATPVTDRTQPFAPARQATQATAAVTEVTEETAAVTEGTAAVTAVAEETAAVAWQRALAVEGDADLVALPSCGL